MIIIADCGGTKSDWALVCDDRTVVRMQTGGINPIHQSEDDIVTQLDAVVQEVTRRRAAASTLDIYFYGAGCNAVGTGIVSAILARVFAPFAPGLTCGPTFLAPPVPCASTLRALPVFSVPAPIRVSMMARASLPIPLLWVTSWATKAVGPIWANISCTTCLKASFLSSFVTSSTPLASFPIPRLSSASTSSREPTVSWHLLLRLSIVTWTISRCTTWFLTVSARLCITT